MRFSTFTAAVTAFTAASSVTATMYITNPIASTSADGGKTLDIKWEDSGSPALSKWGGINLFLATGDTTTQYKLDTIASDLSTSKTSEKYTIPADAGPSGEYYFIRAESTDKATNGSALYQAFSAKFKLEKMTGTFNSTVEAVVEGTSSTSAASTSTTKASGSSSSSSSKTSSGMTTSTTSSGSSGATQVAAAASTTNSTIIGAEALLAAPHLALGALGAVAAGFAVLL